MKKLFLCMVTILFVTGCSFSLNGNMEEKEDKKENQEQHTDVEKETGEELSTENEQVATLEHLTHFVNDAFVGDSFFGYFYENDRYTVDTMSNQVKLFLAIRSLYHSNWDRGVGYAIEVTEKEVKDAFELLFGSDATFKNENLDGSSCGFAAFQYDSAKQIYTQDGPGCGGALFPSYDTKIISATKYKDRMEFIEKVAYLAYEGTTQKVYLSKSDKTPLGDSKDNNIDTYYDQLISYKWTFQYDQENNRYSFYSVEKVK